MITPKVLFFENKKYPINQQLRKISVSKSLHKRLLSPSLYWLFGVEIIKLNKYVLFDFKFISFGSKKICFSWKFVIQILMRMGKIKTIIVMKLAKENKAIILTFESDNFSMFLK